MLKSGAAFFFILASNAHAHMFWVNSFESFNHLPRHTTVSLGWGIPCPLMI